MKKLIFLPLLFLSCFAVGQSVGIGTTSPNSSSILDLGPSAKPFVLPRLSLSQMNAVTGPALGMFIYHTDEHQLFSYRRSGSNTIAGQGKERWLPVSTGPRMLAWGAVDSFATEINGSLTHNVVWDPALNLYKMTLSSPNQYYKDSMLLIVTAVGGGSWDQAVSTDDLLESGTRIALIKFTDVSRIASGSSSLDARRRSGFHFILYDMRKDPE